VVEESRNYQYMDKDFKVFENLVRLLEDISCTSMVKPNFINNNSFHH